MMQYYTRDRYLAPVAIWQYRSKQVAMGQTLPMLLLEAIAEHVVEEKPDHTFSFLATGHVLTEGSYLTRMVHLDGVVTYSILEATTKLEKFYISEDELKSTVALFEDQWLGKLDPIQITLALQQEVSEAMNELDWKWWKHKEFNRDAYLEELADCFIFLMCALKSQNCSWNEFMKIAWQKHLYNKVRPDHKHKGEARE